MPEGVHEHVLTYITASVRTTTRSREILILIIIVSVLVFGAFWNSRQGSWISARIRILDEVRVLNEKETAASRLSANSPERLAAQMELSQRSYDDARGFLAIRPHMRDPAVAEAAMRKLEEIQTEHVLFLKLPFFGLFVDVNDLGMLGGFTFIVLLLWFRSSLWHELHNLRITFGDAGTHHEREFCYKALSMQQVLTTPQPLKDDRRTDHWRVVVRSLMMLPFIVHLTVFCYDSMSFQFGWTVSPANTIISVSVSAVFLFVISWLTYLCFGLLAQIAEIWHNTANTIRSHHPEERVPDDMADSAHS